MTTAIDFKSLTINEIMTKKLVTISPLVTMDKVGEVFDTNEFHHLPVVDEGGVLRGIVAKADYLALLRSHTFTTPGRVKENERFMKSLLVEEVMTKQLVKLNPNDTTAHAFDYFRENRFHALPVVDGDGVLLGLVTTFDLLVAAYS